MTVGSKRKRLAGNENALAHGRSARSSKRRKTAPGITCFSSTSEESQSEEDMEVDNSTTLSSQSGDSNENNERDVEEIDEEGDDSCEFS